MIDQTSLRVLGGILENKSERIKHEIALLKSLPDKHFVEEMKHVLYEDGWSMDKTVGHHMDGALAGLADAVWHLELIRDKLL